MPAPRTAPAAPRAALHERWSNLRHLPRETRDTLFLLAVIGWVIAPHLPRLPGWCSMLAAAVLLWRGWLALGARALPGRWVVGALLAVSVGATLMSYRTLLGKEAGVTMVVVLMVLKTLELRARRDAFVVFFLGFFLVLTHFLYSQSILIALAMVVAVWGLLSALVLAHMPVGQPSLASAGRLSARMCLFGAPVMVALFVLFPRFGPLWKLPQDADSAGTGLSQQMRMGALAELALDDSVALRIRFDGPVPPAEQLYFRGPVLAAFDGLEWRPLRDVYRSPSQQISAELQVQGPGIGYEMTVEPTRVPVLPALEATAEVEPDPGPRPRMAASLEWSLGRPLVERERFRATAYPAFRHGPQRAVQGLHDYLRLPPGYNPRTLAWAAALRREPGLAQADARRLADAVLQHVRRENYVYTLAPGAYGDEQGRHAVDEFWLDRRQGFCEHFAAAFTVVMRALDVPARIVTGYQGGELNPVDGYFLVTNSQAHAWVEYWQEGAGWIRADPTAAVAPERVQRSTRLRAPPGFVASVLGTEDSTFWRGLQHRLDALNNAWNQRVLNYSRSEQLDLLRRAGFESPDWSDLAKLLLGLLVLASVLGAGWTRWERSRQDPWLRAYHRVQQQLAAAGLPSAGHVPPRELAGLALQRWGEPARAVAELLLGMEAERYGRASGGAAASGSTLSRSLARDLKRALARLDHA
ncbi:DUF3488 and transglutaminase-like domain-containing protein [Aquabacterium sp. A7-Y]|uniref:transglutaminase family protein n=1 Tax=Aquabacterium sp. A7-Y TaxID=1349605 RepID=UPI00223E62D7|nr:DUF3488 and transglutaminase-like domain-containing protein [Aquabacterium sp. A7-Y]MCW7538182.1 DUF3488 and transglutaminase-like domain-containing protein [Aquabacterium sp. A7-Y]